MTDTPPANKPPNLTDPSPTYFDLESPLLPRKKWITNTHNHHRNRGGRVLAAFFFFRGGSSGEGQWQVDEITI